MKISGARDEPFSVIRLRALTRAGAQAAAQTSPVAAAAFLRLVEANLSPTVQVALAALLAEFDDLRTEVGHLKGRLAEMESLADCDVLTPLLNRRAFVRELRRGATFAQRYGSKASLAYFDLDGFKAVNDRFGHAAGDAALQAVAKMLQDNVRDSDVVGRTVVEGGSEFAVALVQADHATAMVKAQSLAQVIETTPVRFGEWSAPLPVSFGVREIEADADPEIVLAEADAVMFVNKRARTAP